MSETKKYPTPVTNPESAPFWEAAKQGKFMIKRCTACGEPHYFPRSICPFCFSDKSGKAKSWLRVAEPIPRDARKSALLGMRLACVAQCQIITNLALHG